MKKFVLLLASIIILTCCIAMADERTELVAGDSSNTAALIENYGVEHIINADSTDRTFWLKFSTNNDDVWTHIKIVNYSMVTSNYLGVSWDNEGLHYEVYSPLGELIASDNAFNGNGNKGESYKTIKLSKNTEYKIKLWPRKTSSGIFSVTLSKMEDKFGENRNSAYALSAGTPIQTYRMSGWGDIDCIKIDPVDYERKATFYLENIEFESDYFGMTLYDSYGIQEAAVNCKKGTDGRIHTKLKAGESYYLEIKVDSTHLWYGKYKFGWCTNEVHSSNGQQAEISSPTCTTAGTLAEKCTICRDNINQIEIPATGHTLSEPIIAQEPTCIKVGISEVHCVNCDEILSSEQIPIISHVPGKMEKVKESTCTEAGFSEQHCTVCDITLATEIPAALGHTPGAWQDILAATCTADGSRVQYCAECNAVLAEEVLPAHGHRAMEWSVTREAACLQSGLKEKKCSDCGLTLESEMIDAYGHRYTEWEVLSEATKEKEGEQRRHCTGCGDTQHEKIEKLSKLLGIF